MSAKKNNPWRSCDVCNRIFLHQDQYKHEKSCSNGEVLDHMFIQNCMLHGRVEYYKFEELKLPYYADGSKLVLLSQQAMQLCEIQIGSFVSIQRKDGPPIVKMAWPSVGSGLLSVFLTKEVAELLEIKQGENLVISKIESNLLPAKQITVKCINPITDEADIILNLLNQQYLNEVICVGNKLQLNHLGRKLLFDVIEACELDSSVSLMTDVKYFINLDCTVWKFEEKLAEKKESWVKIGGMDDLILELNEILMLALGECREQLDRKICKGVIIHGPSGCGKTLLMQTAAKQSRAEIIQVESSQIFCKYVGETEKKLKNIFERAKCKQPSIILIDELDVLCPNKTIQMTDQYTRLTATLCCLMDNLHHRDQILVLASTSDLLNVDKSLRRSGRFDREVEISVPTLEVRFEILKCLLSDVEHELQDKDVKNISDICHGYLASDVSNLVSHACLHRFRRCSKILSLDDFNYAFTKVKPSAMKEIMIRIPKVLWTHIAGQDDLKLKLRQAIEWPLKHPEAFERLGVQPPKGLLMYGPPGCSKTMIAKALATESKLNFITVKGSELLSKYVGESEKAVREVFHKARQAAPSIVFFDELDALGGERTSTSGSSVHERVLAQLLTELDGVEPLGNVTFVGATNRPDMIDKSLLRPGRIDRIVYVPLPDPDTRRQLFQLQFRKTACDPTVDIDTLVTLTEGYSGAEIVSVCHEAALKALEENLAAEFVTMQHFQTALKLVTPRTSSKMLKIFDDYRLSK